MRLVLRAGLSLALMGLAACAAVATATPGVPAGPDRAVRMEARHVPLGIGGATLAPGVSYGGGLVLRGASLHGLSDLKVVGLSASELRAWAISDFGALVRFTLRLDENGRLTSADNAVARALTGPDGQVLAPKERADAEGLALLPDGEVLVSFERDHRIWSYGVDLASRPTPVPSPDFPFPDNEGMEGLSADGDGWLVLGEGGGAWLCDRGGCKPLSDPMPTPADGFRFTGADRDPEGGWFVVERYYAPPLDMRVRVRRLSPEGVLSEPLIQLRPPASTDNFEGIAAVATATGTRLYLLSDDNDNLLQKTLLLAFDVRR
ncbi:esterase-like activity of phytase family protein [Brevundimonas staleyi]|uniref:Esterase-like activity of phytase family protein n=1 Tax=Brevundimonas staleyi TaxID=74326 RepID=A0ABW0FVQ9_9CAUL